MYYETKLLEWVLKLYKRLPSKYFIYLVFLILVISLLRFSQK